MTPSFKNSLLLLGWLAMSLHVASVSAADAPVRPKGLTVLFYGNSWFGFVPDGVTDQVKAAGIEGHKEVRVTKPSEFAVLETGEIDVYANGVHWWASDPWTTAENLVEKGLKANPNFRAYFHAAWLVWDGRAQATKTKDEFDSSQLGDVQAALDKTRKGVEAIVDKLNEKFGKRVVFLVPVGDATVKLRELILQGKYPGIKKQSELWTDGMPHPGADVKALSGYCHFAAIYRTSPVGLKITRHNELSDEQHAILQKIAWDVVSEYPYAGIAPEPNGKPHASPDEKGDPKAADPRPVPEQLAGWNGTNELPDGSIVADYNDYIEKLPKAERSGVASVNYYVDGNGRSAVAVLVNVDRVEWTHLLTYDKQNKRAGVTKFVATK
jgi:hypothetical protein